ncbi:ras-related protein rab-32 [Anaeramoeba ignava]|uniref:Ras-related protein rab-32 n=1 Tax=Anaeramoeba ignava TaxID=1746090 RepID=A0A9Q0LSB3_ANAIG|nr:ras-related protein rab-32 [Anaeramoeba ignava]
METEKTELLFKVIVVGDPGVGKTSYIKKLVEQKFNPNEKTTIGVDFQVKTLKEENKLLQLQMWDIAGNPNFISVTHNFYKGASGAFLVFDVSDIKTFNRISNWKDDIDEKIQINGEKIPVFLLGNKCDLESKVRVDLQQFARLNGFVGFDFVSAKKGNNVDETAEKMAKILCENANTPIHEIKIHDENFVDFENPKKKKEKCC